MLLMFEKGIRGGPSVISKRLSKANNKYMKSFNPEEESKFIIYLDVNNLYGCGMSLKLPTSDFKRMNDFELDNWIQFADPDSKEGCILEVNLKYPKNLHEIQNGYPLAPEGLITIGKIKKLIPNLRDKEKYVLHTRNLKQYIELGLKIKKIHRGIKFKQYAWLKPYIALNTKLRTEAESEFEKDFFKLMNNFVFGKTMENIRNRVDIRLVNNREMALNLGSQVNYKQTTIFDDKFIAVHMRKTKLIFDKPVYLGMVILDLSKTLMYDFHYNYLKKKYGDSANLLFTDTDSLMYETKTEDFYSDIKDDLDSKCDTSNYPKDHLIFSSKNKKVIGMMKDEAGGTQIIEFVGLRAKKLQL